MKQQMVDISKAEFDVLEALWQQHPVGANDIIERLNQTRKLDKFEREDKSFHKKIREKYLTLVEASPERFCVLNSEASIEKIQNQIKLKLDEVIE